MADEPKTYTRLAIVEMTVTEKWLTAGGEWSFEKGWNDVGHQIDRAMYHKFDSPPRPSARFIEWNEEPEEVA